MSKKTESARSITVLVPGIQYPEFARLKWQQFLWGFSLAVMLLVVVVAILAIQGRITEDVPVSSALVVVLLVAALLAIYRSGIKREHKRSGLGSMQLQYTFDRDGWTVKNSQGKVTVPWSKTWRVRRNDQALMLYPNRKSVNLVPMRNLSKQQVEQIIAWCTGKRPEKT